MSTSGITSMDPTTLAQTMVSAERTGMDTLLAGQKTRYQSQLDAVNKLKTQLSTFQTALQGLTTNTALQARSVKTSIDGIASVTAAGSAAAGTYSLFVQQLAQAQQLSFDFSSETWTPPGDGTLKISMNGEDMNLDLSTLPAGGDLRSLRDAINKASDNPGVQAALVRTGGQVKLLLTSSKTGAANQITLSVSGGSAGAAMTELQAAIGTRAELSAAQDATVQFGGSNPITISSASNTLDNVIDGLTINLTKAQAAGDQPLQVTIGQDNDAIKKALQSFVDAYNTLVDGVGKLTSSAKDSAGALAGDSTTRSLMSQLRGALSSLPGGVTLSQLGLKTDRYGKLSIDDKGLEKTLANNPDTIKTALQDKGGVFDTMLNTLNPQLKYKGLLTTRADNLQSSLNRVADRQEQLDTRMDMVYKRYLAQFTAMQNLVAQMQQSSALFG